MNVAYILDKFPSRTETFAIKEISSLSEWGIRVSVFAAASEPEYNSCSGKTNIFYKPLLFSANYFTSIWYLLKKRPLALIKLGILICRLMIMCPREAIMMMGNIHTIGFFAKHIDRQAISHIHAYFLSWPACIGMATALVAQKEFSISAHARDIFVEKGAANIKASHAKFIRTCTEQGLRYLKTVLLPKYHHKLQLNYHGVNTTAKNVGGSVGMDQESKFDSTIIAVGRFVKKKGFTFLIKAFEQVLREIPKSRLMLVGDGPEQKIIRRLAEQTDIVKHVEFAGWQRHKTVIQLVQKATVLVMPSIIADDGDRDGVPNVILEAFSMCVPVVASNLEGIAEAVKNEQTGLLISPGNTKELACAIIRLLNDKYLRTQLSQDAYNILIQRFDSAKNTRQLAGLFRKDN